MSKQTYLPTTNYSLTKRLILTTSTYIVVDSASRRERRWGEGVIERDTTMDATASGGGSIEGGNENIQKTG